MTNKISLLVPKLDKVASSPVECGVGRGKGVRDEVYPAKYGGWDVCIER